MLKAGMQGGSATDSLDPATWQSQVPYFFGRQWGEQLVQIDRQRRNAAGARRGMGRVRRRQGLDLQDPQGRAVPQRQGNDPGRRAGDHGAPFGRQFEVRRARHHAGHRQDRQGRWRDRRLHPEGSQCRPAVPDRRLPPDDPAERRQGQSDRRHRHRSLQDRRSTMSASASAARSSPATGATIAALPTRSKSSSSTTRRPACRRCRAARST